ncbi:MAG: polysaccharide deacetylase family protein [Bacillota bacterium]|nr:polysaccharide deacetylase family protein [Bacillota bacterium]
MGVGGAGLPGRGASLAAAAGAAWLAVEGLPELLGHYLHAGVVARGAGDGRPRAALTFDDGPDPASTPRFLEALDRLGVPATFFMVGRRAAREPALVREVLAAGHTIGNHTWSHRHAWTLGPAATLREIEDAAALLEDLGGRPVRFLRPPWGAFNWAVWLGAARTRARIVLWSAVGDDWKARATPASIVRRVRQGLRPGAIVLLHDAGGAQGAPERTLAALPELVARMRQAGFALLSLEQLLGAEAAPAGGGLPSPAGGGGDAGGSRP